MSAAMFTIFCFTCFLLMDASDGNYMTLSSSDATVGQPLTLQCKYVGTYTPIIIKFYFNMSVTGLQIVLSSCTYLSTTGYNTALYDNPTCGAKEVSLIIKSVTQADIGTTWECDASFSGGPPTLPAKSSIVIKSQSSPNPGNTPGLSPGEIAAIVIAIIIYVLVRAILIWLILTRKHLVDFIFVCTCAQGLSNKIRILIIIITCIIPGVGEVILIYLLYKLWMERHGTQKQPNVANNRVTPEHSDMEKGPPKELAPISFQTENSGEAKRKNKKQKKKKNGENTPEKGSFEKDNNFLNEK